MCFLLWRPMFVFRYIQFYITYSESSLENDSEHILKYLETNKFNKKFLSLKQFDFCTKYAESNLTNLETFRTNVGACDLPEKIYSRKTVFLKKFKILRSY